MRQVWTLLLLAVWMPLFGDITVQPMEGRGYGVVAKKAFDEGQKITEFRGTYVLAPEEHTLQVGEEMHLRVENEAKFINHSSKPNARVVYHKGNPLLVAIRAIQEGEEVTFDFNTTEWEITQPIVEEVDGKKKNIAGFKHLDSDTQASLLPHVAPHIKRLLADS